MAIIHKTRAIVLKTRDWKESSYIASLYTKDFGNIHAVAKGVKRLRAKYDSRLMPFSLNEIIFYESRGKELHTLSEIDLIDNFDKIRKDLDRIAYASYFCELVREVAPIHQANKELFELLYRSLKLLDEGEGFEKIARVFEVKLLSLCGLMPLLDSCVNCGGNIAKGARFSFHLGGIVCASCTGYDQRAVPIKPGTIATMSHFEKTDLDKLRRVAVTGEVRQELGIILRRYIMYHLEKKLRTLTFMEKMRKARA